MGEKEKRAAASDTSDQEKVEEERVVVYTRTARPGLVRIKGPGEEYWRPYPVTLAQAEQVAAAHGTDLVEDPSS